MASRAPDSTPALGGEDGCDVVGKPGIALCLHVTLGLSQSFRPSTSPALMQLCKSVLLVSTCASVQKVLSKLRFKWAAMVSSLVQSLLPPSGRVLSHASRVLPALRRDSTGRAVRKAQAICQVLLQRCSLMLSACSAACGSLFFKRGSRDPGSPSRLPERPSCKAQSCSEPDARLQQTAANCTAKT